MLTYESITIGQRVEVLHEDRVLFGTVLYKGSLMGRRGLWLGIDLTTPDGDTDGSLKGRVYFRAPMNYGIFTTIENVRLASNFRRKLRSTYRTVNKKSLAEEELFGNTDPLILPPPRTDTSISNAKVTVSLKNPHERPRSRSNVFNDDQKRFTSPQVLARGYDDKVRKQREKDALSLSQTDTTEHTFSPTPSIPKIFMPPCEVDRAKRSGFGRMSIPRFTVVHDQNDFLH